MPKGTETFCFIIYLPGYKWTLEIPARKWKWQFLSHKPTPKRMHHASKSCPETLTYEGYDAYRLLLEIKHKVLECVQSVVQWNKAA